MPKTVEIVAKPDTALFVTIVSVGLLFLGASVCTIIWGS